MNTGEVAPRSKPNSSTAGGGDGTTFSLVDDDATFRTPVVADGHRMWEIARDTGVLDLNSTYAYVLWAREFSRSSVVVEVDGTVVGFVTGFIRPEEPDTVFVWQVGVEANQRGKRLAARLINALFELCGPAIVRLRTTISPDNEASQKLFSSVARDRGMQLRTEAYLAAADLGEGHEPEDLYTIAAANDPLITAH